MNDSYLVIEDYSAQYKIPISLAQGEIVKVGEKFTENPDWPGWIWCENQKGEKGWALERILTVDNNKAIVTENFSSKELDIEKGEYLEGIRAEAGWLWCRDKNKEMGWVPLKNVKQIIGGI